MKKIMIAAAISMSIVSSVWASQTPMSGMDMEQHQQAVIAHETMNNDAPGQPVFPGVCARSIYAPRILSALQLVAIPATQPLAVALVVIKDM
ncbi:hypothetical protein ACDB75_003791 [Salmonella enterica]